MASAKSVNSSVIRAEQPFVSCLLPTRDRPAFVRQALQYFLRQTYDRSELIVLDDGGQSAENLCSGLQRVRHVQLSCRTSIGQKLNVGVELARGSVIQKLDDDDYYHPEFLSRAVETLIGANAGDRLVAWDCFLVLLAVAGERSIRYSGHGWHAGGTLCFHRKLWEAAAFRDVSEGEDWWFVQDHGPSLVRVCAPTLYVLVRHGRNTWVGTPQEKVVDQRLQDLPIYPKALDDLIPLRDLAFYRSLIVDRVAPE